MRAEQPEQSPLACPYCHEGLARSGNAFRCPNGHNFDIAREGYVNLAVGKHPGDTKEMLRARRAFLDTGHYAPLADAINERIAAHLREQWQTWQTGMSAPSSEAPLNPLLLHSDAAADGATHGSPSPRGRGGQGVRFSGPRERLAVLDAGCGEGYYSGRLASYLAEHEPEAGAQTDLFGLDIARDGIQMAAKRVPGVSFVVANLKAGVPFRMGSLTALLNVFAPRHSAEFARVIAPGGLLLIAMPRLEHLAELRARLPLLAIEEQKREHIIVQFAAAFSLHEAYDLTYQMALSAEEVALLAMMTPTRRQATPEAAMQDVQESAEPARVTAAFTLLSLLRT